METVTEFMERIQKECIDKYKNTLYGMIEDSTKNDTEYGALFCTEKYRPSEMTIGKLCAGNECSVSMTDCKDEKNDKRGYGSFHTHPTVMKEIKPSNQDVSAEISKGHAFFCIGSTIKDDDAPSIKCFVINHESDIGAEKITELAEISDRRASSGTDFMVPLRTLVKGIEESQFVLVTDQEMDVLKRATYMENIQYPHRLKKYIEYVERITEHLYDAQGYPSDVRDIPHLMRKYIKQCDDRDKFVEENYDDLIAMQQTMKL